MHFQGAANRMLLSSRLLLSHNLGLKGGPNFRWQDMLFISSLLIQQANNQDYNATCGNTPNSYGYTDKPL